MKYLGLIIVLFSTAQANPLLNKTLGATDYRLPGTQIPSHYKIDLIVSKDAFNGTINTFEGTVAIDFKVSKILDVIQIHAPMKINSVTLDDMTEKISYSNLDKTTSIRSINLPSALKPETNYTLRISFTADIDIKTMFGFYRSSYKNEKGDTEYLLSTQFEPVHARKAFPCFDEPNYKATFAITITYPKGYNAISNTNGKVEDVGTDQEKATFEETPKISTYLIAFIVSKFTCSSGADVEEGVPSRVCSRIESESQRKLAVKYGPKLLNALEDFTGIKYGSKMAKMDQAAIPDFDAGAMENWGLVTYRERELLFDEEESSNRYKQTVVSVIAHEFTHQWFGDLVTCSWWDYIFLNEGFATYFQYFILTEMKELSSWEFGKQFVVDELQPVLIDDGLISSKAITAKSETPTEVSDKFDHFVYNKAASIIRMMKSILGDDKFKLGLQNYLKKKTLSDARPEDLLAALEEQAKNLPEGFTFTQLMDNWLNVAGYPVLRVAQRGKRLVVRQERFLYKGEDSSKTIWNVPLSLTLGTEKTKFESVTPKAWLTEPTQTIDNIFNDSQTTWLVLNNQQTGFYRVLYTNTLWQRIADQLVKDHTQIDVLNRGQIIDDLFNFARSGHLKYSDAFYYTQYLNKETDYYPWVSALTSIDFLVARVNEGSSLGLALRTKVLSLLEGVYASLAFDTDDTDLQIPSLTRDLIFNAVCNYGHEECIQKSTELFELYKNGTACHKNLKKVVYTNGIRYSKDIDNDWKFLWGKYLKTKLSTEQVTILSALGATTDITLLKKYLELSITADSGIRIQDLQTVWASVYTSSFAGTQAAFEYITANHDKVRKYYPQASSLLKAIGGRLTNQEQIKRLETFLNKADIDESYKTDGKTALDSANDNVEWLKSITEDLEDYLQMISTTSARTTSETDLTTPQTDATTKTTVSTTTTTKPNGATANIVSFVLVFISVFKCILV